jgi:nifR3 family TIM-barrel protein
MSFDFDTVFAAKPVILAPMEDVTDAVFRRLCRTVGASLCITEFALAEGLVERDAHVLEKIALSADDTPTAIQIYGSNPEVLAEAASSAEQARPAYIDINCGCWVPKVTRGGAGASWLRSPDAMVAMASMVVKRTTLPVTVKTRIGWGDEADMPIVDLARRLEDVGVRAITIHCRTARMGHEGPAHWQWAGKAQAAVHIPVIVNGAIRTANDCQRALTSTGCAGVMIGRRAIEHPWLFREARARLDHAPKPAAPTRQERLELCKQHLLGLQAARGTKRALKAAIKFYPGYLAKLPDAKPLLEDLQASQTLEQTLTTLENALTHTVVDVVVDGDGDGDGDGLIALPPQA